MKAPKIGVHFKGEVLAILFAVIPVLSLAQTGAGSATLDNSLRTSLAGQTTYEYAETLYLGPNAVWNISGTHVIYSKNIWIAPTAVIEVNDVGSIIIANPDDNPFYPGMTGPTTIDGNNGNPIGAIVRHQNPNNIILADIEDPGYGTFNPAGPQAASLHFQNDFIFDIDGADILLNGNNLLTSGEGTLSGYGPDRMVVTGNSITAHLIRLNAGSSSWAYFPVGIAEADYTPAYIEGPGDYHVSVTSYSGSGLSIARPQEGMDRIWHVYGGPGSTLGLQHNSPSTDGNAYNDSKAFITRYLGNGAWTSGVPEQIATGVHENIGTTAAEIAQTGTANGAWLTKTSDIVTPLPVHLVAFSADREGNLVKLNWVTLSERDNKQFEIERSTNGSSWGRIGSVLPRIESGNSDVKLAYQFEDIQPVKGLNYYRLKQIDLDGKFAYSQIRAVRIEGAIALNIYPNPAVSSIQITGFDGNANVCIYDNSGRQVLKMDNVKASQPLPVNGLSKGMHHLVVTEQNGSISHFKLMI